jgi:hypothetical protein
VAQADRDEGRREDRPTTEQRQELTRLRRKHRRLKEKREMLAKAAAQVLIRRAAQSCLRGRVRKGESGLPAGQAVHLVTTLRRGLGVSPSDLYTWRDRAASEHARR